MKYLIILPIMVGSSIVIQSGINEKLKNSMTLGHAMLFNNLIFLSLTICYIFITNTSKRSFFDKIPIENIDWTFFIPGVLGFVIVSLSTISFDKLGAARTTFFLLSAQLISSMIWSHLVEDKSIGILKLLAVLIVIVGVGLFNYASEL